MWEPHPSGEAQQVAPHGIVRRNSDGTIGVTVQMGPMTMPGWDAKGPDGGEDPPDPAGSPDADWPLDCREDPSCFGTRFTEDPWQPSPVQPADACDGQAECTAATDEACDNAGFSGVKGDTVLITVAEDGTSNCSGDCQDGCNDNGYPVAFISCS